MPPIVTITSDWKKGDYYASALVGDLLSFREDLRIEWISRDISAHNVVQSAFIQRHSCLHFPPGSIHLNTVLFPGFEQSPIGILKWNNHFFVGPDDGRFSLLMEADSNEAVGFYHLMPQYSPLKSERVYDSPFSALPLLLTCVKAILEDKIEEWCVKVEPLLERVSVPVCESDSIVGKVMYIDSYGNLITNISKQNFMSTSCGRSYAIFVNGPRVKLNRLSNSYSDLRPGALFAIFNSVDLLELGVFYGNLSELENMRTFAEIRIRFYD